MHGGGGGHPYEVRPPVGLQGRNERHKYVGPAPVLDTLIIIIIIEGLSLSRYLSPVNLGGSSSQPP